MDFLGLMPIPIFFSSALADDRYGLPILFEPIFGADITFAPSICIKKEHLLEKCNVGQEQVNNI